MKIKLTPVALFVSAAIGLTACGNTDSPALSQNKTVTGVITGFGSVFVNGVEYETGGARITVDDSIGVEDNLAIGMVVTLKGSVDANGVTGLASSIEFADEIEGFITAVDHVTSTLTVMGQQVSYNADTKYEGSSSFPLITDLLASGSPIVEVSGYSDGNGNILATRIEVKKNSFAIGDELEVKGVISSVDTLSKVLGLNNDSLMVDYSNAVLDMNSQTLGTDSTGLYVEVKSTSGLNAGNQLVASKIEIEGDGRKGLDVDEGNEFEIEGIINAINLDNGEITINGQTVKLSGDMLARASSLVVGSKIELEGRMVDGVLTMDDDSDIEEYHDDDMELEGVLDAVDVNAGTVQILGFTVQVNNRTVKEDDSDAGERYFDLSDLNAGTDWVSVDVYRDESGNLLASSLERDDDDMSTAEEIEGRLSTATNGTETSIMLGGISVALPAGTSVPALPAGTEVKILVNRSNGSMTVQQDLS